MNANRIDKYKELMATYAECHRKVVPIINTCLDNITGASASIDPLKVSCRDWYRYWYDIHSSILEPVLVIHTSILEVVLGVLYKAKLRG